jgi:plastocyanin
LIVLHQLSFSFLLLLLYSVSPPLMMYASILGVALAALPAALVQGAVHDVAVGPNGTLTYDPPFIMAAVGDMVSFTL